MPRLYEKYQSNNPVKIAKEFYDTASKGGIETTYGKGKYTKLSDGTIMSYREISYIVIE